MPTNTINTNQKILVVEDDPQVRALTCRILRFSGYNVVTAENGRIALETLRYQSFDIIVTDIMMPVMDGLEFLHILRHEKENLVPVIVMTGSGQDLLSSLRYCNLKSLTKPYEMDDLLDMVASFGGA